MGHLSINMSTLVYIKKKKSGWGFIVSSVASVILVHLLANLFSTKDYRLTPDYPLRGLLNQVGPLLFKNEVK